MIRPHRKDGYVPRLRVQVRVDSSTIAALDELAISLALSRAHLCDLILGIAVAEGGDWLRRCINGRVKNALQKRRAQWST